MLMLMSFRPVTRGRLKRARIFALCVFLASLALYGLTALHYAFPGRSAALITFISGLDVIEVPTRPLLRLVGGYVASLSFGPLPFRLNLCSAVAAALTLGWLYKIVWFFVFENMREESAVTKAPRISRFAALAAVLAVGSNISFLYGATRFNTGIIDAAMIVGCIHIICVYGRSRKLFWMALLGVATGLCAAESPLFIAASPLIIIALVITEWKQSWYRVGRLFLCGFIAAITFFLTHFVSARSFLIASGEAPSKQALMQVLISVFRKHAAYFSTLLPRVSWFLVLAFGVGFAFLAFFTILRSLDNRRTWMLYVVKLALSLLSVVTLFNLPISVWSICTGHGVIPVFSSLLACTAIGLLVASWRAQAVMKDPCDEIEQTMEDDEDVVYIAQHKTPGVYNCLRVTGVFATPALMLMIIAGVALNLVSMLRDDGSFMDMAARQMIEDLGQRKWVVSNGLMDHHILIAAAQQQKEIVLLAPYRVRDRRYARNLCRIVEQDSTFTKKERDWAVSLINYNLHMFINDFFAARKNICSQAVCMGLPDIWYDSGKVPVPELLFYGGNTDAAKIDGKALLQAHNTFYDAHKALLAEDSGKHLSKLSRGYMSALRRHLAFVANNLGVALDELDMQEEAFAVYERTLLLYPDNISALLNQFEMVSRGLYPEKRDLIEKHVKERVRNVKDSYPLWALNRYFGYVRNYELFVNMGWEWAVSSSPGSVIAGLRRTYAVEMDKERRRNLTSVMAAVYEMQGDIGKSRSFYEELIANDPRNAIATSGLVRLSLKEGGLKEARRILEQGQKNGISTRTLRKDWAALYLMAGDLARARTTLQAMADEPGAEPMTIAMLAMVMIEQGEFAAVESKVLPRLVKMEKTSDNYFVLVIQGRIYQMKGKRWFPDARKKFLRAFAIRPDVVVLREIIFRLDVAMGDRRAAEAHAIELLRRMPSHPLANFFMGTVALEEGDYGKAADYLKRAAEAPEPTVEALNNYAQLLCRIKKTDEAIKVARQATELAPERYEVWSTLAYILQETDDLDGATRALIKASAINKTDKRLVIIDGLIALKRGDMVSVKRAVDAVGDEQGELPVTSQRDLQKLKDAL